MHWPAAAVHRQFHVARGVLGARALVNLPKLKTHGLTTLTGALKNTFGVIPGFRKAEYHVTHPDLEGFSRMLADLNGLVRSGLVVMDAIAAMEGNGPRGGTLVDLGLLIVSDDPVAVDAVACRIAGIDAARVPLLRMAEEAGVGRAAADRIEIRGDPVEGLATAAVRAAAGASRAEAARVPLPVRRRTSWCPSRRSSPRAAGAAGSA